MKLWRLLGVVMAFAGLFFLHRTLNAQEPASFVQALQLEALPHPAPVAGAAWNEDESRLLTWAHDGTLNLWDNPELDEPEPIFTGDGWFDGAVWTLDQNGLLAWLNAPQICSADCAFSVYFWQTLDSTPLIFPHPAHIDSATLNTAETLILTAAFDGTVRVWDLSTQAVMNSFQHEGAALGATWNQDESRILSWSVDGTARLWDSASGVEMARFSHGAWVDGAAWVGEDRLILTWGHDGTARLWESASGQALDVFRHSGWITSAAISRDGARLLTASTDGTVRLWDVPSGTELRRLDLPGAAFEAAWNTDESRILVRSVARTGWLSVWDAESGTLLATLPHPAFTRGAHWNADESRLLTWADDGLARVWIIPRPQDCLITTPFQGVNQRESATTDSRIVGQMAAGDVALAMGQATGADGLRWWQLAGGAWVREDVVEASGTCETLPEVVP